MTDTATDTRRLGRGFILTAWIALLILLTLLAQYGLNDAHNPNRHLTVTPGADGLREVKLVRNRYGHYLTPGEINGRPALFMLDTGATEVVIPAALETTLGLTRGRPSQARTANGAITVYRTTLDTLRIGPLTLHNVRASLNPNMRANDEILLGMSALKHLELIARDGLLTLRQPAAR